MIFNRYDSSHPSKSTFWYSKLNKFNFFFRMSHDIVLIVLFFKYVFENVLIVKIPKS